MATRDPRPVVFLDERCELPDGQSGPFGGLCERYLSIGESLTESFTTPVLESYREEFSNGRTPIETRVFQKLLEGCLEFLGHSDRNRPRA